MTLQVDMQPSIEERVRVLIASMTLEEKVGQTGLVNGEYGQVSDSLRGAIAAGRVGAILNEVDLDTVNELQRIAVEESRLGIPLLVARDVIHGFKTVFPIPLGQAATWNPELVLVAASIAATEATASGVNWTFSPMVDIARDPRWGRVAESPGEDPYLGARMAAAQVRGYQGRELSEPGSLAACAKHFAGYGAAESGLDYNTTNIPENELRSVHLPPFAAAVEADVASLMTSFSELDGIPASANAFLLDEILRREWGFDGLVVSDWDSVRQLAVHGLTDGDRESALEAARAGVDMEMAGGAYADHLADLVRERRLEEARLDRIVGRILRLKMKLGLFDQPFNDGSRSYLVGCEAHLRAARDVARQSVVLLQNRDRSLPLRPEAIHRLAVIGPMADEPREQLGTWTFDGMVELSVTPLQALRERLADRVEVGYARGLAKTVSRDREGFVEAVELARQADAAILFLGEEAILSGEAHCRADIRLPGAQEALIEAVADTGTRVIVVLMTGRPLALEQVIERIDALMCAWHPGSMAGPAIADLLLGTESPSGKLPVTFPRVTGQIPIYYARKNTGKPPTPETVFHIAEIEADVPQLSEGNVAFHMDVHYTPLFCFGHGLSYSDITYESISVSEPRIRMGERFSIGALVSNMGEVSVEEVVQLYVRDPVASVTRPVRELRGFRRISLEPGEQRQVCFDLTTDDLAFVGRDGRDATEPGRFEAWIGGSSDANLHTEFEVVNS